MAADVQGRSTGRLPPRTRTGPAHPQGGRELRYDRPTAISAATVRGHPPRKARLFDTFPPPASSGPWRAPGLSLTRPQTVATRDTTIIRLSTWLDSLSPNVARSCTALTRKTLLAQSTTPATASPDLGPAMTGNGGNRVGGYLHISFCGFKRSDRGTKK